MLSSTLIALAERQLEKSSSPSPTASRQPVRRARRKARIYIAAAERHLARGEDSRLVAALVRAAWRAHEEADAMVVPAAPSKTNS
jgi:hypothetical protein